MTHPLKRFVVPCLLAILLLGCQQAVLLPTAVSPQAAAGATAVPTNTTEPVPATSEPTAAPTETTVSTNTPELPTATHTAEPTSTNTSTPEPTETSLPPTETAVPATSTPLPVTPTTAPTTAPVQPPAAPAPTGANLLVNPGFEAGTDPWRNRSNASFKEYEASGSPHFVHSGQKAIFGTSPNFQYVDNVTPGTTYRAGVWVKIWSSKGEDRTISEEPGNVLARVCININGDDDPNLDSTICSNWVQPFDVWQFISVDGVAANTRITIILQSGATGALPKHNEIIWDDATLGTAPTAATATPGPTAVPTRPEPIPFDGVQLRDSMNNIRSQIEQMGGLLDRVYNGEAGKCSEYQIYYVNIVRATTYHSIPDTWQGVYNEYIAAVDIATSTNGAINELCTNGGGGLTPLNYGVARTGINDSLNRLIPAIETADSLLSQ